MKSQLPACPKEVMIYGCNAEGARELVNTILSQQQALAKQAQKHTAYLEAHDQIQNYSCLSVGVCTFVSHLFCESTELSLQTMTCEQIHPFSTLINPGRLLLKSNTNSMIPFALRKLHSWMSWVCKKLATHNSTKSSTCFWSASLLDQECPGNGH
jgi:hypothetical protein